MDFEQFKWGVICVGMGACLSHLLFSGKVWRYRIVAHDFPGGTGWLTQRRLVFWPFWSNMRYHSAFLGYDLAITAYSSEEDAVRAMPRGCEFHVVRKMSRPL